MLSQYAPYSMTSRVQAGGSANAPIDLTGSESPQRPHTHRKQALVAYDHGQPSKPSRKRKSTEYNDNNDDDDAPPKKKPAKPRDAEKRLRVHRKKAPLAYAEIRQRALTQRMFVIDRQRSLPPADIDPKSPDNHPTEEVSLAGTTGNIYQITISRVPSCNCPHARKGNQCKHIVYVLARVLRAPEDLEYQLAFVSSELREIFERAPPLPSQVAQKDKEDGELDGNRKPLEGEDCPICMMEFETDGKGKPKGSESVVYCKAACGNNIHKQCFQQWAATKKGQGNVTCPFCRSPWQAEETSAADLRGVAMGGRVNAEGYVNVAAQLGLSGRRDTSTYNEFWLRRQSGGYDDGW
ncbi:Putative E3 ubiquitin-protein ligase Zswim2 [Septoria linicola]|uniref:E3 ubiquitin-protein ligase Zswim2 n=1 Tax=Septoria linicola TaxID=215465 RepID=A0A9Q9EHZ8_9PEZI|nr:putative E3 ubiquitin-protein ligase Zswim2 [Septoria linicola]USW50492.1 Putative E3 ubiquitin-protein ligase Zswim2 [Septoria linicola]